MSVNCAQKRENFADSQKPDRFCRECLKPLMGKGWSRFPFEKTTGAHVRKWQKRSKMTFLDQNPILRACPTRAPGHRVACTLLPFTVLKHRGDDLLPCFLVACTLLPFTVLKLRKASPAMRSALCCMHPITVYGIETTSLARARA